MTIETNGPSLLRMIGVMAIGGAAAWARCKSSPLASREAHSHG